MSKSMAVPVESLLHQYRMNALTTPLSSYEMTNVDKEMSDVLSRTDIPADQRLKMYFGLLNKYKHVYNVYSASQTHGKTKEAALKEQNDLKEAVQGAVKGYLQDVNTAKKKDAEEEEEFRSVNDDDEEDESAETVDPKNITMLEPSADNDNVYETSILEQLSGKQRYGTIILDDKAIYNDIVKQFDKKEKKALSRTSLSKGGDQAVYGYKHEIPKMFRFFFAEEEEDVPKYLNKRLLTVAAKTIYDHLPPLFSKSTSNIETYFPNLISYLPSDLFHRRGQARSPTRKERIEGLSSPSLASLPPPLIPSKTQLKKVVGKGETIRIMFNKWNDLIH